MAQQILKRRGTAAAWTAANPVLGAGEEGYETDTRKSKVGDGSTAWVSLSYLPTGSVSDATSSVTGAVRLAGDLAGTAAAPSVARINGIAVTGTPSAGQVLTAGSSSAASWSTPAAGAGDASTGAKGVVQLAGDLAGTAAAPTVARVSGVAVSGTPSTGQVLQATSSSAAAWANAPSGGVTGTGGSPVSTTSAIASDPALSGTYAPISAAPAIGSDSWLKARAVASRVSDMFTGTPTIDSNGVLTASPVKWEDGSSGQFTATSVNSSLLCVDGYTVTYVVGATTKTVTQPQVTRTNGTITTKPDLTVS